MWASTQEYLDLHIWTHTCFFASRTWNLYSNTISSQCLICCPCQRICSQGHITATPQNTKHQWCWFEALFMLTSRCIWTIHCSSLALAAHTSISALLCWSIFACIPAYFSACRIIFLTVSAAQLSMSFVFWFGFIIPRAAKHWEARDFTCSCANPPSKSPLWAVESL